MTGHPLDEHHSDRSGGVWGARSASEERFQGTEEHTVNWLPVAVNCHVVRTRATR
jgi:hypothetical protein